MKPISLILAFVVSTASAQFVGVEDSVLIGGTYVIRCPDGGSGQETVAMPDPPTADEMCRLRFLADELGGIMLVFSGGRPMPDDCQEFGSPSAFVIDGDARTQNIVIDILPALSLELWCGSWAAIKELYR